MRLKPLHFPVPPDLRQDGPWFEVQEDRVTWRGYDLDADPQSFVALTDAWAVDENSVFVQYTKKRTIDRESFRLLNPVFAVDNTAVYDWHGVIKHADPHSFEVLDAGLVTGEDDLLASIHYQSYGRDKHHIWFHEQMIGRASPIKSADRASFRSFQNGYGADTRHIYLGKYRLAKSDPTSWLYLGQGYSMDHARVWFFNREIKGIHRENFFVVNLPSVPGLATDGERFFSNDTEIDAKQFEAEIKEALDGCSSQIELLQEL